MVAPTTIGKASSTTPTWGATRTFANLSPVSPAADRQLFRFPPPDHPYYTRQTLDALEAQYPGWNARGEYRPRDGE